MCLFLSVCIEHASRSHIRGFSVVVLCEETTNRVGVKSTACNSTSWTEGENCSCFIPEMCFVELLSLDCCECELDFDVNAFPLDSIGVWLRSQQVLKFSLFNLNLEQSIDLDFFGSRNVRGGSSGRE